MREVAVSNYRILTPFTSPWPFFVVDNFLSINLYNELIKLSKKNQYFEPVDHWNGKTILQSKPDGRHYTKCAVPIHKSKKISNEINKDIENHLSELLFDNYFVIPDLVRCDPNYFYGHHKDHEAKKLSIVVYLHPEQGDGTVLVGDKEEVVVKWRPNRAVVFENAKHGTHWYKNTTDKYRYTLNIYITEEKCAFNVINKKG